jgi:hypothetical protein
MTSASWEARVTRTPWAFLAPVLLATIWIHPVCAGEFSVKWNPAPGASGYRVYYGVQSGVYTGSITTPTNSGTITGLNDCQTYYVAVKAFNAAGESPRFSNELMGWSHPSVTSTTPSSAMQGDQLVMDIFGSNFQDGAIVELRNPHVNLNSVSVLSCTHIQLLATIEPTARRVHAARIGHLDVEIENPDSVYGVKPRAFEVLVNPARFDINQSDDSTTGRIDGKDTVYLSRRSVWPIPIPTLKPTSILTATAGWMARISPSWRAISDDAGRRRPRAGASRLVRRNSSKL